MMRRRSGGKGLPARAHCARPRGWCGACHAGTVAEVTHSLCSSHDRALLAPTRTDSPEPARRTCFVVHWVLFNRTGRPSWKPPSPLDWVLFNRTRVQFSSDPPEPRRDDRCSRMPLRCHAISKSNKTVLLSSSPPSPSPLVLFQSTPIREPKKPINHPPQRGDDGREEP
jgi:hypothetical protein